MVAVLMLTKLGTNTTTRPLTPPRPLLYMDDKPEMKSMLCIERSGQECFRIVEAVTEECQDLGLLLELPEHLVRNVWKGSSDEHSMKCQNIISKWLEGKGKQPVTWRTFIDALKLIPLPRLASELESLLPKQSSWHI